MIITIEKYSKVIDGLRTQLELLREYQEEILASRREWRELCNSAKQQLENTAKQSAALEAVNAELVKENNRLIQAIVKHVKKNKKGSKK
jgi:hypothetical protein